MSEVVLRRRWLVLVLGMFAWPASASASDSSLRFSWVRMEGAESCPSEGELKNAVRARLGRDPFSEATWPSIEGVASREASGFGAKLVVRSQEGEAASVRELSSRDEGCDALGQAVALAVAVVIDPSKALTAPSNGDPTAAPAPQPSTSTDAMTNAPKRAARIGRLWASGVVGFHVLPGIAFGGGVGGEIEVHRRLSLLAGMFVLPEVRRPEGFAFGLTSAFTSACIRVGERGVFEPQACAGVQLGALHAVVFREDRTHPGQRLWFAPEASVRALFRLGDVAFTVLSAGASVPIPRYRFFVEGSDRTIHRPSAVVGRLELGLGMQFQ